MPKVEKGSEDKVTNTTKDEAGLSESNKDEAINNNNRKTASPLAVASFAALIFIVLIAAGSLFVILRANHFENRRDAMMEVRDNSPRMGMRSMFFARRVTSSEDTRSVINGVVKSVGSNSFIVAGDGSQTTINTSGSTAWNTTDKKVSENDSVQVIGEKSDNTINATAIYIVNN
jgi:hypothetical protein